MGGEKIARGEVFRDQIVVDLLTIIAELKGEPSVQGENGVGLPVRMRDKDIIVVEYAGSEGKNQTPQFRGGLLDHVLLSARQKLICRCLFQSGLTWV